MNNFWVDAGPFILSIVLILLSPVPAIALEHFTLRRYQDWVTSEALGKIDEKMQELKEAGKSVRHPGAAIYPLNITIFSQYVIDAYVMATATMVPALSLLASAIGGSVSAVEAILYSFSALVGVILFGRLVIAPIDIWKYMDSKWIGLYTRSAQIGIYANLVAFVITFIHHLPTHLWRIILYPPCWAP